MNHMLIFRCFSFIITPHVLRYASEHSVVLIVSERMYFSWLTDWVMEQEFPTVPPTWQNTPPISTLAAHGVQAPPSPTQHHTDPHRPPWTQRWYTDRENQPAVIYLHTREVSRNSLKLWFMHANATIQWIHIVFWDVAHITRTGSGDPLPPSGYQRLFRLGKKFDEHILLIQWVKTRQKDNHRCPLTVTINPPDSTQQKPGTIFLCCCTIMIISDKVSAILYNESWYPTWVSACFIDGTWPIPPLQIVAAHSNYGFWARTLDSD